MRVLLCLLSEQHVPNLLSVHHFQPDRLVLVETTAMQTRRAAENFLRALHLGGLDYGERCDVELLHAEDNLDAVRAVLRSAFGKYPSAEWIANVTGGTKPMSIAAFEFFKATAGRVVYTNFTRPNVLLALDSSSEETCEHKLSISEFLAGYGFESRKADEKIREAEGRARKWAPCAGLIAKHASCQDILSLSDDERATARKKGWEIQPGRLKTASPDVASAVCDTFSLQGNGTGDSLHGCIDKYVVEFLTGGWLEVYFWELLSRHADALGLWDVRLGLEVGRRGDSSGNDFDVAFMREYGLAMVECKSGSQDHDPGSDILYKVEAVTRQFRALRVRSYLATTGSNVLDASGNLKTSVKNRASIYNCRIVTAAEIKQIANGGDTPDAIRRLLFNATEPKR
jgi:hypothetical protein